MIIMIIHTIRDYLLFKLRLALAIDFRFLSKAIFTCGVKKLLYELNSSLYDCRLTKYPL